MSRAAAPAPPLCFGSPVESIPGIGEKRAAILKRRGLTTVGDLLFCLPGRYQDWRSRKPLDQLVPGEIATIEGRLHSLKEGRIRGSRRRRLLTARMTGASGGTISVVWFNAPSYMLGRLSRFPDVLLHGKVNRNASGQLEMLHPAVQSSNEAVRQPILPVYGLGEVLGQNLVRSVIQHALTVSSELKNALPAELLHRFSIPDAEQALRFLHQPPPEVDLAPLEEGRTPANLAIALTELFAFQVALVSERQARTGHGIAFNTPPALSDRFLAGLPFDLTQSQRQAIKEIRFDMARPVPMNRLLMGDVGSGKTVVALWAVLRAVEHGYQAAVMAPTELLAEQHQATFRRLCEKLQVRAELLNGSVPASKRAVILSTLASGDLPVVFGTQALIQSSIRIPRLGLAIIDEQHRFGVFDRARLKTLGPQADMLLLSATPIPRTLARIVLSNLDLSLLSERPKGRQPVTTGIISEDALPEIWPHVRAEVERGKQAFCILPLIDDPISAGEGEELPALSSTLDELASGALAGLRLGKLHGSLTASEKERVMRDFRDGRVQILFSTTVIEVGIDVPNATLMIVMAAQRYGLAQLHQLRGRIGRGQFAGKCYLVLSDRVSAESRKRLEMMAQYDSGAEIATADLKIRGPGDVLGFRQSGPLPLRFARWLGDLGELELARELAIKQVLGDPYLESTESSGVCLMQRRIIDSGVNRGGDG